MLEEIKCITGCICGNAKCEIAGIVLLNTQQQALSMFVHPQTVFNERGVHYVFNHIDIEITYRDARTGEHWVGSRLISAKITPRRYIY